MAADKVIGAALIAASIVITVLYGWLLFFPPREGVDILILKLTAFGAVAGILGIIGWIGYTLATTPPPKPIEEIEKELEEELKRIEKEIEEQEKQENNTGETIRR